MRTRSPITCFLILFALFGAIFAPCRVVNAVAANPGVLANISSRARVGTGDDNVVIAGFIITGIQAQNKTVLIRGMGPTIPLFGILADPTLVLRNSAGAVLQSNNNWKDTQQTAIQATGLAPTNDFESAMLLTLPPGTYTVALAGNNGGTGVGLIEIYDMSGTGQLGNLSTRAQVGTGDNVLIGGLTIRYSTTVVLRANGPSLGNYGIKDPLEDPTLDLRDANGALVATNDDWQDTQAAEIQATGLAPSDPAESAIRIFLAPGTFTAIVQGVSATSGTGVVDVFALPDTITLTPSPFYSASNTGNSPTINWTSWTNHQIWKIAPNTAQGGQQVLGTTTQPAGNYSFSIPIPGSVSNAQQFFVVDSSIPDTAARTYRAKAAFGVTLSGPPANSFPRSFVAWANASNLAPEDPTVTLARHDLVWMQPAYFGWWWQNPADYQSETLTFVPNTAAHPIPTLRSLNPNIKILASLQHYSLYGDPPTPDLPVNFTPWWLRQSCCGNPPPRIPSPFGGGQYLLNQDLASLRLHVRNQAISIMASGAFDGIFMDHFWPESAPAQGYGAGVLQAIIDDLRVYLPNALIVVNANAETLSAGIINKVNGVFMESAQMGDWNKVKTALIYNEASSHGGIQSQQPRLNCLETNGPRNELPKNRMRATTCLSLIFSNGYALWSDVGNHEHDWYHPFWSNHSLGTATSTSFPLGTAFGRDFQNGRAVWNPNTTGSVQVTFGENRTSLRTGTRGTSFSVPATDGDIFTY